MAVSSPYLRRVHSQSTGTSFHIVTADFLYWTVLRVNVSFPASLSCPHSPKLRLPVRALVKSASPLSRKSMWTINYTDLQITIHRGGSIYILILITRFVSFLPYLFRTVSYSKFAFFSREQKLSSTVEMGHTVPALEICAALNQHPA